MDGTQLASAPAGRSDPCELIACWIGASQKVALMIEERRTPRLPAVGDY
jgi:hypothetical protein